MDSNNYDGLALESARTQGLDENSSEDLTPSPMGDDYHQIELAIKTKNNKKKAVFNYPGNDQ